MNESKARFWTTPNGVAAIALIAAVGYFLLTEHRAHTIAALPWLILLLCPLMHVFMHRGHGHGSGEGPPEHRHSTKERD
jgi:hypothetical protein